MTKNAFLRPKSKKVKKADSTYFLILYENISLNSLGGPPGLRKGHYLLILLVAELLTHFPLVKGSCGDKIKREKQPGIFSDLACLMERRERLMRDSQETHERL